MTNEWNGVCACGKVAMDGVKCRLGATHEKQPEPFQFPWAASTEGKDDEAATPSLEA